MDEVAIATRHPAEFLERSVKEGKQSGFGEGDGMTAKWGKHLYF